MFNKVIVAICLGVILIGCSKKNPQNAFILAHIKSETSIKNVRAEDIRSVSKGKFLGTDMNVLCGEVRLSASTTYVGGWRPFSVVSLSTGKVMVDVARKYKDKYSNYDLNKSVRESNKLGVKAVMAECQGTNAEFLASTATKPSAPKSHDSGSYRHHDAWYEGGTLHSATASEWLNGSLSNRLATSADFIAKLNAANNESQLKSRATALSSCITEAVSAPSASNADIKDVAVLCVMQLGYK